MRIIVLHALLIL